MCENKQGINPTRGASSATGSNLIEVRLLATQSPGCWLYKMEDLCWWQVSRIIVFMITGTDALDRGPQKVTTTSVAKTT